MQGESEALGEAAHVRVHCDAVHDAVRIAEYDIGGFASNAAERQDFMHGVRNFAVEFFFDEFGGGEDGTRFGAIKSGGIDVALKFFLVRTDIILQRTVFFEKTRGHLVYFFVGALRRENDGD